jgi:hypothetical protein
MNIDIVSGDDWEGLYVDGVLVYESHTLTVGRVLRGIGVEFTYVAPDPQWLEERGSLPDRLDDVKRDE